MDKEDPMDMTELWGAGPSVTLNFFYLNLRETPPARNYSEVEAVHVAGVLAHYARMSFETNNALPTPQALAAALANLPLDFDAEASDAYNELVPVLHMKYLIDAAQQTLLAGGYFRDHIRKRGDREWYDHLGMTCYEKAFPLAEGPNQRWLFGQMKKNFPIWAVICQDLNRRLRENPLLIRN